MYIYAVFHLVNGFTPGYIWGLDLPVVPRGAGAGGASCPRPTRGSTFKSISHLYTCIIRYTSQFANNTIYPISRNSHRENKLRFHISHFRMFAAALMLLSTPFATIRDCWMSRASVSHFGRSENLNFAGSNAGRNQTNDLYNLYLSLFSLVLGIIMTGHGLVSSVSG